MLRMPLLGSQFFAARPLVLSVILTVGLFGAVSLRCPVSAAEAESVRESSSLKFIPAVAAFYGSSLRLREQYEAAVNSKAFAQVWESPLAQFAVLTVRSQWESPQNEILRDLKDWCVKKENEQLVSLLLDAVSHEVFAYGGTGWAELLTMLHRLTEVASAKLRSVDPEIRKKAINAVIDSLVANAANLKVPTTVIGFKVSNRQAAAAQFKRLQSLADEIVKEEPRFKTDWARKKWAGRS